jgi:Flp pilus assembly protein TadD
MTWVRASLVGVMSLALGCASGSTSVDAVEIAPNALLEGAPLGGVQDSPAPVEEEEVLAVSPEMQEFLSANVHRKALDQVKLQELIDAIINAKTFGLEFEGATHTASETFRLRRGNCLSFCNMFVAMARSVGLNASYQEVDIPPDWTLDNEVFILNRHVNVLIEMGQLDDRVVDFNIDDFRSSYDTRLIPDTRARAHYFNNIGVEHMQRGETAEALANFRRAIADNDRQFSPAWTNLGTLYLREGYPAYAEAAYRQALKVDKNDSVAMSNLARLYEREGDTERAALFRKKVSRHRNQNPYYRYNLAREAYAAQNYNAAISHLRYAIGKKNNEDQFYFLLGMCYLQKGNAPTARRWLARAEQVAATDALKRRYSSKLEMLLSEMEREKFTGSR